MSLISTLIDDDDEEPIESENDHHRKTASKTRMSRRNYRLMKIYESKELAEKAVEQESIWSLRDTKESKEGLKMFYRCKLVAYRAKQQCSAGLYILLHNYDLKASIYKTDCEHDHVIKADSLNSATKSEIIRLLDLGITKPKSILENLRIEGKVSIPAVDVLYNFLARHRKSNLNIASALDLAPKIEASVSSLLLVGSHANKRKNDDQPRKERSDKWKKRAKKN